MEQRHIRFCFSKKGNIRFISHLDMSRAFLRAMTRAEVNLKMSEGFSPHPKMSFPLPLSVGMESEKEILDVVLDETETSSPEELKQRINEFLPEGLFIEDARPCEKKSNEILYAEYEIVFPEGRIPCESTDIFKESVFIEKKTKKGVYKKTDVSSGILSISVSRDGTKIETVLSASGSDYTNPEHIITALKERYPETPDFYKIIRKRALDKDKKTFI